MALEATWRRRVRAWSEVRISPPKRPAPTMPAGSLGSRSSYVAGASALQ